MKSLNGLGYSLYLVMLLSTKSKQ